MEAQSSDMSLNESLEDTHCFLDMELETLQSIYINEIEVKIETNTTTVSIVLHPATADKLDEQYVRMELQFILEEGYPEEVPKIKIRNPRGLSDEKVNCIMTDLLALAESKRGSSMLFEMIEAAKEHLTTGNRPSGECAICLYGFSDNDVFTKTECYHYFHSHCLARYTKNFVDYSQDYETDPKSKSFSNELLCPMCRIPIKFHGYEEDFPPPGASDESNFVATEEILDLQKKMADLYQKQVENGGIIDIEAEKNKYLIEISNVPTRVSNEEKLDQKSNADGDGLSAEQELESNDQVDSPSKEIKEHNRDQSERSNYRGKNRNFNRQNESRGNFRYNGRYNKPSYNDFRGKYNRGKYERYYQKFEPHRGSSLRNNEESGQAAESAENTATPLLDTEKGEFTDSVSRGDDPSETTEQEESDVKGKRYSNYSPRYRGYPRDSSPRYNRGYHRDSSPRYNRGYRRGNNYQYNPHYDGGRKSDKPNFEEDSNTHAFNQRSIDNDEDQATCKSEDRDQKDRAYDYGQRKPNYRYNNYKQDRDFNTKDRYKDNVPNDEDLNKSEDRDEKERTADYGARKSNYRSDHYRQDRDFNSRERYSDSRNSPRDGRGGYVKRGNYSHDSNYGRNRYADSDKDNYYSERDRNYRGRRTPSQGRYKNDNTYDGYRQKSSRNFAGNAYAKHTDEHYRQPYKDENRESVDISSKSQNSKSSSQSTEKESLGNAGGSGGCHESFEGKSKTHVEKSASGFDKNNSKKLSDKPAQDGNGLNIPSAVMTERPQGSLRTALNPPPGFANPLKKVIYGLQGANPPPGFNRS